MLTAKYKTGLFENPYGDSKKAAEVVRCAEHKKMALDSARKSIVLLKNENVLPLRKDRISKIAVFGLGATLIPVGENKCFYITLFMINYAKIFIKKAPYNTELFVCINQM